MTSGKPPGTCGVLSSLGVVADGSYALCGIGENFPALVFGQVGKAELNDIWRRHPVILQLRENLPGKLKGICGHCLMKSFCRGSCVAQNYYRANNLFAPFWFCEAAAREGLFLENRLFRVFDAQGATCDS